jgi:ABC-type metal ion transport system substrate-binding protein
MKMMKLTALAVLIVVGAAMAQETEKKMAIKVMVSEDHDNWTILRLAGAGR